MSEFRVLGTYKDGGSHTVEFKNKIYSIDNRIQTKTKGRVYTTKHPSTGKLVSVDLEEEILKEYSTYNLSKNRGYSRKINHPFYK